MIRAAATGEQVFPWSATAHVQILVQRLPRDLRQLEPDRPASLPMADIGSVDGVAVGCHVIHRKATRSQPRSLLSIARLNIARSRVRFSSCSFARIAQTWPGRNGGFGPGILPLFQAGRPRRGVVLDGASLSFMVSLPA